VLLLMLSPQRCVRFCKIKKDSLKRGLSLQKRYVKNEK
jgi:hypothetical protein